ncbi:hypothetical protein TNCV_4781551 [Trichonephila clavipes]|nr:hypothetical protein TNCV_4781551 [Trichonephila clavipes]
MIFRVKGINCPSNKNLNSQHLNLLAIRVEELGIPRGCVMLKIIRKTSPTRQINAVETNERFQEQSSAILTAKVAIPVYSPAKENEKIDELQFVHIKCGNEILKAVIDTGAQISRGKSRCRRGTERR